MKTIYKFFVMHNTWALSPNMILQYLADVTWKRMLLQHLNLYEA